MRILQLEAALAESGLAAEAADELRVALAPLQQPDASAPSPSAALAALFPAEGNAPSPSATLTPIRGRGRRAVSGALVLALASVGATGLSAAANTLPTPWQHQVSEFAHRYLPFDLPEPRLGPSRQREPLSGAGTPRTTAGALVPSGPQARQAPRDHAPSSTAFVPRESPAKPAGDRDATAARPPRSTPVTTTRSSTRWEHSVVRSAPAPTSAPPAAPSTSSGKKSTGPQKSPDAAAPADSKATGKNTGKDAGKGTGSKSANPQGPGAGRGGGADRLPAQGPGAPSGQGATGKGPVSGPVKGPATGPVLEVVRGSGGQGGPGGATTGPGDTVETGLDAPRPQPPRALAPQRPARGAFDELGRHHPHHGLAARR